jgi:predicted transposase YbfD/YdcC
MEFLMSKKIIKIEPEFLVDFLQGIKDPRIDRTKKHELIDILVIAICAVICGAKSCVEIEDFGEAKQEWFSIYLNLNNGIPSHDTFRRLFMILDPEKFLEVFIKWVAAVTKNTDLKQICVDGKTLRRSFDKGRKSSAIHMVNAWSTGASLSLGSMISDGKGNEIKTIPKILDLLDIKGSLVSNDAMGCQINIAKKIISKEADYLLALKGNQPMLEERVAEKFNSILKSGPKPFLIDEYIEENNKKHGRFEKRKCRVITKKEMKSLGINPLEKWPSLNSLIEIQSQRINAVTGIVSEEKRYYISSSTGSAKYFLTATKSHWEVENKLHWVLDVAFKEDDCRCSVGNSAQNFAMLRQFALNLVRQEPTKKSVQRKQKIAGWVEEYLLQILLGGTNIAKV